MQESTQAVLPNMGAVRDWRVATKLLIATALVMVVLTVVIDVLVVRQITTTLETQITKESVNANRLLKFLVGQQGTAALRNGKLEIGGLAIESNFAAVDATNAGRRAAYARSAADAGTTADVAGARMFESQLLPRISSGQWYRNAQGQWVQR